MNDTDPSRVSGAYGWMDGHLLPVGEMSVPVVDRTLIYGLGAFETVRLFGGRAYLLERHLDRLHRSLEALDLPVPAAVACIADGLGALSEADGAPDALARVTVTAGSASGGGADMRVFIALRDVPARTQGPVIVGVADFAHDTRSPLVGVKSTSYLVHYLLRERAEAGGRTDDLMVDGQGRVTEATVANAFVVAGGRLITPPLSEGILAGVTRARVLELAHELGQEVAEETLGRAALGAVDEVFLTGAGKCLLSVDVIDGRTLPVERPFSDALRLALRKDIAATCGVELDRVRF